ncbi:MAG: hypothetical protein Q9200_001181 [Gallowayella weberi]
MTREAPFSSITAGPSSSTAAPVMNDDDDNESGPTSTTRGTFTITLRKTVSSSLSTLPSTLPPTTEAARPPVTEAAHHSSLGAGLGGGLGGAAAVLINGGSKYHEMDATDPTHRHNSTLSPAELNCDDSKVPPVPAELGSNTTTLPGGPYELQGDTGVISELATSGNHQDSPLSETTATPPANSRDIKTTKAKDNAQDSPGLNDTTIDSDLGDTKGTAAQTHRPSAHGRSDSQAGPWHDTYQ